MRVLIINPILYTAETDPIHKVESIKDTMIYSLCTGFLKKGDEPTLIAAGDYKPVSKEEYPFRIEWMESRWKKICKPRYLPLLKGLSSYLFKNKDRFDYIITSEVFSLATLSSVLFARKKTVIWHELGAHNKLLKKIPSKLWYNIIPRIFMRKVPVIPRSQKAGEFIKIYCNNVLDVMIDHGVDIEKIGYSAEKSNYFVVLSQLIERKRVDGIIDKFNDFLEQEQSDYTLKIIGSGGEQEALMRKVHQMRLDEKVIFYGSRTHREIAPVLMSARALLVNTVKDNSMVSIAESIAAGTPVVTTSVPFNAGYIKEHNLGIVADKWGAEELSRICRESAWYVENCLHYRERLSNVYCAEQFRNVILTKKEEYGKNGKSSGVH